MAGDRIRNMGRRQFIVELQPYRDRTDFIVKRRTFRGGDRTDQVLQVGTLRYSTEIDQPRDLIRDLRRIADVLERRYGGSTRGAGSVPLGGKWGEDREIPGLGMQDWVWSGSEPAIDTGPAR